MPSHGGKLRHAAKHFGIPLTDWLDLSTGINPHGWAVPEIPAHCWQRLPEDDDELLPAARDYYGCQSLLAVAGSQAAIQCLPKLRRQSHVLIPAVTYSEHAYNWQAAGHHVTQQPLGKFDKIIHEYDVVVVVNPNNPTGELISTDTLLRWHASIVKQGGWLIVDEAFIDTSETHSLLTTTAKGGLIILRSLGKFFGLAGLRCGFVSAATDILTPLSNMLGPWSLSHPTRWIATQALRDLPWQGEMKKQLNMESTRLKGLIDTIGGTPLGGTSLFQTQSHPDAVSLFEQFAQQAILTRLLDNQTGIRFGLPGNQSEWDRLEKAIKNIKI